MEKPFIYWMDENVGNYTNFKTQTRCKSSSCCVNQFVNGSWGFMECDFQYDVWCYITLHESHKRIAANYDQLTKNATELIEMYNVEQFRSDNVKRLAAILQDVKDVIRTDTKRISSGEIFISTAALILSLIALMLVAVVWLKMRKGFKAQKYREALDRSSFKYPKKDIRPRKPELSQGQDYPNDYGRSGVNNQSDSLEGTCLSFIDSLVTSEPQEL